MDYLRQIGYLISNVFSRNNMTSRDKRSRVYIKNLTPSSSETVHELHKHLHDMDKKFLVERIKKLRDIINKKYDSAVLLNNSNEENLDQANLDSLHDIVVALNNYPIRELLHDSERIRVDSFHFYEVNTTCLPITSTYVCLETKPRNPTAPLIKALEN